MINCRRMFQVLRILGKNYHKHRWWQVELYKYVGVSFSASARSTMILNNLSLTSFNHYIMSCITFLARLSFLSSSYWVDILSFSSQDCFLAIWRSLIKSWSKDHYHINTFQSQLMLMQMCRACAPPHLCSVSNMGKVKLDWLMNLAGSFFTAQNFRTRKMNNCITNQKTKTNKFCCCV